MAWLRPFLIEASVAQFLAVLKLSRWDPVALEELFPLVIGRLSQVPLTDGEKADLRNAITRTQSNHYSIGPADHAFELNCRLLLQALETTKTSDLSWN